METVRIKDVKQGDFVSFSENPSEKNVWRYSLLAYLDSCKERFVSGDKYCFVDFDF